MKLFYLIIVFNGMGFFTSVIQKFLTMKLISNVALPYLRIGLEISIVITSIIYHLIRVESNLDTLISDRCSTVMEMTLEEKTAVDTVYTYMRG